MTKLRRLYNTYTLLSEKVRSCVPDFPSRFSNTEVGKLSVSPSSSKPTILNKNKKKHRSNKNHVY